jgi:hypothetical protein
MTISDTDKIDFLWKKVIYGTTKTANGLVKTGANESIGSPPQINPSSIWTQADLIPGTPPVSSNGVVQTNNGSSRIEATTDPTSAPNQTWLATGVFGNSASVAGNFIPPLFGPGYLVQVYVGDPNSGPAARIFPDTVGYEYVFDYSAGVLIFLNNIPAGLPATIGSGTVSVSTNGVYFQAYRYVGTQGVGNGTVSGSYVSKLGDTMTGPLQFDYTSNSAKTVLLYANATSNSYAGMGTLPGGETRIFADSNSVLSFGHISTADGQTYVEAVTISNGVLAVGGDGDGVISTNLDDRIILGHQDVANSGPVSQDLLIEPNGVVYIDGFMAYHTGNLNISNSGSLTNTGVTPGFYHFANVSVDQYGRILSASNGVISLTNGTVTSVGLTGSNAISVNGSPITGAGSFTVDLTNSGVVAGTYTKVVVDAKGRVTNAALLTISDVDTALGYVPLANNQTVTLTGDASGSGQTSIAITLATVATPGTYYKVSVDAKGRVTSGAGLNSADITGALGYTPSQTNGTVTGIALTGSSDILVANAGTITTAGAWALSLSNTTVAAGVYTAPTLTIDAHGRVTSASNGAISGGGNGTVTSVALTAGSNAVTISGSPITTSGVITVDLTNTGVAAGTYTKVSVDTHGRVLTGATLANTDVTTALGFTPLQHNEVVTVSGDATGSGSNAIALTLTNTAVIPGTYSLATVTVDSKGRLISVNNGSATNGTVTSVSLQSAPSISITGTSPITSQGTFVLDLSTTGVVAGTYTVSTIVVDSRGRISNAISGTVSGTGTVTNVAVTADSSISVSGSPITNAGTISLALSTTGVAAGAYSLANIVVDAQGRITSVSNGTASGGGGSGTVTNVAVTADSSISVSGSPVTTAGVINLSLSNTGVAAGTYEKVVVDIQGRVHSGSALINTDVTTALGFTPVANSTAAVEGALGFVPVANTAGAVEAALGFVPVANSTAAVEGALGFTPLANNQVIVLSGDASGSGSNAISVTLANTLVTPGTYTSANIVVDSKGRITLASNGTGGGGGGGVATSYNNASVVANSSTLNFTGNGVSVTVGALGATNVNVPGNVEWVEITYAAATNPAPQTITANSAGVSAVMNSTLVTFTFTGYNYPPVAIIAYGQNYLSNIFTITTTATMTTHQAAGGGTSAAPTFFGNFSAVSSVTLDVSASPLGVVGVSPTFHPIAYFVFKF